RRDERRRRLRRHRPDAPDVPQEARGAKGIRAGGRGVTEIGIIEVVVRLAWLIGAGCFVIGLMRMNSPATARNGNLVSAGGMTLAIGATAVLILSRELLGPEGAVSVAGWA